MNNNKKICEDLLRAETEKEVIKILKKVGYWDDRSKWRHYGDVENNIGIISNQQSCPVAALVEKITNSIDSVLIKNIKLKGIDPESDEAPKSPQEAAKLIYNDVFDKKVRSEIANNVILKTSGKEKNPNYTIIDKGEGQAPNKFSDTFLSINKSNKNKIKFVQGRYNMGGTGVLDFCGENNLQLIISKKCPELRTGDESEDWGFTIVRRQKRSDDEKNDYFTYLAPDKEILSFKANKFQGLSHGSLIKLYDYKSGVYKTSAVFNLWKHLSVLLPNPPIPFKVQETRKDYQSGNNVMNGLNVRLKEHKNNYIEKGFPQSSTLKIDGNEYNIKIHAFIKKGKTNEGHTNYKKNEGILFTMNGQTQYILDDRFFTRINVNLNYIAKSLIVEVDCSKVKNIDSLFMASRDRVKDNEHYKNLEKRLESLLANDSSLRKLQEKRKKELFQDIQSSKQLKDIWTKMVKKDSSLAALLKRGSKILNPHSTILVDDKKEIENFVGEDVPTFFDIFEDHKEKECEINRDFRIFFQTDAKNGYDGDIQVTSSHDNNVNYGMNFRNGIGTLTVALPKKAKVGMNMKYKVILKDKETNVSFKNNFEISIINKKDNDSNDDNTRRNPPNDKKKGDRKSKDSSEMPPILEITKDKWEEFDMNENSALQVKSDGKEYTFIINVDNKYLVNAMKNKLVDADTIKHKYILNLVFNGISYIEKNIESAFENLYETIEEHSAIQVKRFCDAQTAFKVLEGS